MADLHIGLPALWMLRMAVAAVWIYEGLWSKLLGGADRQVKIVEAVPVFGPRFGAWFLKGPGALEFARGIWVLSGFLPSTCAVAQVVILVALNINGLLWARRMIHDPAGMVVKNACFLLLAWVMGASA